MVRVFERLLASSIAFHPDRTTPRPPPRSSIANEALSIGAARRLLIGRRVRPHAGIVSILSPDGAAERETGLEPATIYMASRCSTTELLPRHRLVRAWWAGRDLNPHGFHHQILNLARLPF